MKKLLSFCLAVFAAFSVSGVDFNITNAPKVTSLSSTSYVWWIEYSNGVQVSRTILFKDLLGSISNNLSVLSSLSNAALRGSATIPSGASLSVNADGTLYVLPSGQLVLNGDTNPRAEMFLHGTNAFIRFDEDAGINDSTSSRVWKFNRFNITSNNVATLGEVTNIVNSVSNPNSATLTDATNIALTQAASAVPLLTQPWGTEWIYYDDFSRTNRSATTNIGPSLSHQIYQWQSVPYDNASATAWYTNLVMTNGWFGLNSEAGYPSPSVSGIAASGKIFFQPPLTNGTPNYFGGNFHFQPSTNFASGWARPTIGLITQDTPLLSSDGHTLLWGSNWMHTTLNIHPDNTEIKTTIGTPGVSGFTGTQYLYKQWTSPLQTGIGNNASNQTFEFSFFFPGNNTLVARVGSQFLSMTLPWLDACHGTNFIFEFLPETPTNLLYGTVFAHQIFAGSKNPNPDNMGVSNLVYSGSPFLGTTNQIVFGKTNNAPAAPSTIIKWVSVQVSGETNAYRIPLYQ